MPRRAIETLITHGSDFGEQAKKKLPSSIELKRAWIEPNHPQLSIRRQCELLHLNHATFYRQPGGESDANPALMRRIAHAPFLPTGEGMNNFDFAPSHDP